MGIKEAIYKYSKLHREDFNDELFRRDEKDFINDLMKIISSVAEPTNVNVNRKKVFIGVNYFNVIEDYREVRNILHELESEENRRNKRIDYNIYDYINLKDSLVVLLEVNYHVEVDGNMDDFSVYIEIPKVYNKYYIRIDGTEYNLLYQISDASTYNNSSSKKKLRSVSFRQEFQRHVVYEKKMKVNQVSYNGNGNITPIPVQAIVYTTDLFGNNIPIIKYFLAKYGVSGTMTKLEFPPDIVITFGKPEFPNPHYISFYNKDGLFVSVPYMFWENMPVLQSFVYTILTNAPKKMTMLEELYDRNHWLASLGGDFKSKTVEKGELMLDSVNRNFSLIMQDGLKLPYEDKATFYDVLKWQMYEFEALYNKNNYDMTYKKLRLSAYVAGFYAAKLTRNLISSINASSTLEKVSKSLKIPHGYILDCLKSSKLVAYKNGVNDDDTFAVLKATFKGESGIGENKTSAVPVKYRLVDVSHAGKVDCDTSPAGDPGMTCLVCPYAELEPGGYLGKYQEPNNWRELQDQVIDDYRKISSEVSIFRLKDEILGTNEWPFYQEILDKAKKLLPHIMVDPIEEED